MLREKEKSVATSLALHHSDKSAAETVITVAAL